MRNCASGMQALDSAIDQHPRGPLESRARRRRRRAVARAAALLRRDGAVARELVCGEDRSASAPRLLAKFRPGYLAPVIGLMKGLTDPMVGSADGADRGESGVPLRHHAARDGRVRGAQPSRVLAAQKAGHFDARDRAALRPDGQALRRRTTACARIRRRRISPSCKPFFDRKYGNVTAGNSSQITDGAAWLVLASGARGRRAQARRRCGRIVDCAVGGARSRADGTRPGARRHADPRSAMASRSTISTRGRSTKRLRRR